MVVVEATHCSTTPPIRYPSTPLLHFSNSPFSSPPALSLPRWWYKRSHELQCVTFASVLDLDGPRSLKK
jgi:hypothetical protein